MAFSSAFLLVALFAISATANGILTGAILGGVLSCTNTSVALAGTYNAIPNAKVDFVCGLGSGMSLPAVIQSTRTNTAGIYSFLLGSVDALAIDSGRCYINATIPPNSCILNIPASVPILRIPVFVLKAIDTLLGTFLILIPGALSWLPV